LFDEVRAHDHDGPPPDLVKSAVGVLSVMDREVARAAADAAVPLYVVDSLLWMRDSIPSVFRGARRYWAQNFLGLRDRLIDEEPMPAVVGPIVAPSTLRHASDPARLLVNLGGCESPDGPDANVRAYSAFVVAALRRSRLFRHFAGRTTLMAGERCIDGLGPTKDTGDLELVSVSHASALERLAAASVVLTAPGLTMTLESFQSGVPTYFLPPQNYSQWCVLRRLRAAGLAPHALHWEDLADSPRLRDRMPESERNPLVRAAIARYTADDAARDGFSACMDGIVASDHGRVAAAQTHFFESLGPNGALTIAGEIIDDLRSELDRGTLRRGRAPTPTFIH
jgi:hypothetical protein